MKFIQITSIISTMNNYNLLTAGLETCTVIKLLYSVLIVYLPLILQRFNSHHFPPCARRYVDRLFLPSNCIPELGWRMGNGVAGRLLSVFSLQLLADGVKSLKRGHVIFTRDVKIELTTDNKQH